MKLQRPDPGIDAAKSGLHGKAGIFFNAGLFSKGGGFNPLDLDPYLLFDARTSMIGTLENPTLDLDPSKQDTLDVITATRAGTATFTDVNGLIASAPANTVRVDQTQGAELTPTKFQRIGYTDFSQGWAAQSGVVAQGADDYQGNAVRRLTFDGVTTGGIYQTTINTIGGVSYTGSFYIRRISGSTPLYMRHGFSASGNQTAISVTTEWQQFSVTMLGASGGGNVYFGILQFGAGNDVYEITQPQFEEGTTASSFVENTTGSPKFITGPTFGPRVPMILVEPSATNLVTYSEDFSQSSWDKQSGGTGVAPAITSNDTIAPDGTQSADKVVFNKGAADDPSNYSILSDAFPAQQNTASVFIKADTHQRIVIRNSSNWVAYDVTTEWTRIEQTDTGGSLQIGLRDGYGIPNVPDTATVYIWGAQVESGSVATSLIPTSGSTVTRAADDLVISGSAFTDFFNATEGTTYVETAPKTTTNIPHIFEYHNSSDANANRMGIYLPSVSLNAFVRSSGVTTASLTVGNINLNQLNRVAISYKVNDILGSLNGASEVSDTSAAIPSGLDKLHIGNVYNFNFPLNGHIKRLIYWPYHSDSL
jgi:hypothetical protein